MPELQPSRPSTLVCIFLLLCSCLSFAPTAWGASVQVAQGKFDEAALQPILHSPLVASQWEFSLPEYVLQQSFLFQGSTGRIKQVLMRLLTGETVHIGSLGGSVTVGRDAGEGNEYFSLVTGWMAKAFPKAKVIGRNGAISGTPSMYVERFMNSRLDPEVDLVFLEYAVNNRLDLSTMHYEDVKSYERILRSVLKGAHHAETEMKPAAVLIVNMWRSAFFNGTGFQFFHYTEYLGDHYNILAQYYAVPSVAVRNGLYHAYRLGGGIFTDIKEAYPPNDRNSMTHPNKLGHKFMADMIIYAFYVVLGQLQQNGMTQGDFDIMNMPQPPPLVAEPDEDIIIKSWHDYAIKELVSKTSGWEWGVEMAKGGFFTTTPGAKLTLQVDTRIPKNMLLQHPRLKDASIIVHLGMLQSYEHMGEVKIKCTSGCTCTSLVHDTNNPKDKNSQTYPFPIELTESSACKIQLECLGESTSTGNEHKLVLRGVSVTAKIKMPDKEAGMPFIGS